MMIVHYNTEAVLQATSNLLSWFETVEQREGLGGPVVHWWGSTFDYCGPGMDWRLEGYLLSLLNLFKLTEDDTYLKRILKYVELFERYSYKDGSLRVSHFQANPMNVGSPHESAAYYGLASVAAFFKKEQLSTEASKMAKLVGVYINSFLLNKLWNDTLKCFNDWPYSIFDIVTPNKVATIINLLFSAQNLLETDYSYYIKHCADWILRKQSSYGKTRGGICQTHRKYENLFFPYYNSRCVIPLQKAYDLTGNKEYLECKNNVIDFILRNANSDFGFKQIVVADGEDIDNPRWIAGMGDILHALLYADSANDKVKEIIENNLNFVLCMQMKSGVFPAAQGFSSNKTSFKDIFPVSGWNDKMLNFLTRLLTFGINEKIDMPASTVGTERRECFYDGKEMLFEETERHITLYDLKTEEIFYLWNKKEIFPEIVRIQAVE
ncbi:hypothetical protein ACFLT8_04885 [Chloroflexota bacterium]